MTLVPNLHLPSSVFGFWAPFKSQVQEGSENPEMNFTTYYSTIVLDSHDRVVTVSCPPPCCTVIWPSIQFVYMSMAVIIRYHSVFCQHSLEITRRSRAVFNLPRFLGIHADIGECFSGFQTTENRRHTASSADFHNLLGRTLYALLFLY